MENRRKETIARLLPMITIFSSYFIFGLSENIKGPAIPRMQSELALTEAQLGLLLALNSLGYLLACTYTSALSKKIGLKRANIACYFLMAAAGVMIALSRNFMQLNASYFAMYLGNGMLEITLGLLAARTFTKNPATMMNLSHFFYGLSSVLAPMLATFLMGVRTGTGTLGWRGMYAAVLLSLLVVVIPSSVTRFPSFADDGRARLSMREYLKKPVAWLIIAVLSFGVTGEMAMGGWLVNYLEKAHAMDTAAASGALSGFFVCFTLARLLFGPVIDRMGLVRSLVAASAFAGGAILLGVVCGRAGVFLLMASGFGLAVIYPTVMALLTRIFTDDIDTAMTITLTIMGITNVVGNIAVGAVADVFTRFFTARTGDAAVGQGLGYGAGCALVGVMCLLCTVSCLALSRLLRREGRRV